MPLWSDTRPILLEFVCGGSGSAINPRRYFSDVQLDVSNTSELRARLLSRADAIIDAATAINAQGVVVWDLDGIGHGLFSDGTHDHDFTYVGNPSRLSLVSPEMHACADAFFAKLTAAGLRAGLTLRPQTFGIGTTLPALSDPVGVFIKTDAPYGQRFYSRDRVGFSDRETARQYTGPWKQGGAYDEALGLTDTAVNWTHDNSGTGGAKQHHLSKADAHQKLLDEIAYSKARWGASLFYIDTNINLDGTALNASVFDAIHAAHPDVLLLPEWEYLFQPGGGYYRSTVPYQQANMRANGAVHYTTPAQATYENPGAQTFVVLKDLSEADYQAIKPAMARQIKDGKIILGAKWFDTLDRSRALDLKAAADALAPDTPPAAGTLHSTTTYTVSSTYEDYSGHTGDGAGMRD